MAEKEDRWGDMVLSSLGYACKTCRHRMPDTVLPNGFRIPQFDNIKCQVVDEKPASYFTGTCPFFELDEQ